ncbi:MAG: hypothetical protein GF333_07535 [Candidatus Omnitrophica bacterium]|nr:hypothetical protein [Candidatus Omnitrophota bacterium]
MNFTFRSRTSRPSIIRGGMGLLIGLLLLGAPETLRAKEAPGSEKSASHPSTGYVNKAWAKKGAKNYEEVYEITNKCIEQFGTQAQELAARLSGFPPAGEEQNYRVMNNVATCYFIKAEALRDQGRTEEAIAVLKEVIGKYPYAQAFDPRGWYWSIKEKSEIMISQMTERQVTEEEIIEEDIPITLYDPGEEFPVEYEKYGTFSGKGTTDYQYKIEDQIGLAKAVGEGIYPNTSSVRFDPDFIKIKKTLGDIDHWEILNSRDYRTAFFKWNLAPEPPGVKMFYIADILERSGLIRHAVKAYYAVLVHYPRTYAWTYWHTPWYPGRSALYRLKYLLKNHPELGLKLKDAAIIVKNGHDNDIRNDVFVVSPGKLTRTSFWEKIRRGKKPCTEKKRAPGKIIQTRGGKRVKLVQFENGDWELRVDGKPFMIKAITYAPTRVGESPDDGSLQNWTTQDVNQNGKIDGPYDSWVDVNGNNQKDENEKIVGDFQLMKEMGVNAIRLYIQPFQLNKDLLGQMHEKYGIYVIIGDFLGKYALGSGASWEEGTDYENPEHQQNMLESVKKMVLEHRDEPYVLMWLLGNENVYGLGCNADKKPESFFRFANKAAKLVKSLDPEQRPVAISSGDTLFLHIFSEQCPDIDVFGTNSYRGKHGFLDLWDEVKRTSGKPALLTEYGAPSYGKGYSQEEAQNYQAEYHRGCWEDIFCNSAGYGAGNALGGVAFEWLDEWWKAYEPGVHDTHRLSAGPFLDGYFYEEWFGLCGQGDGIRSPYLRHLKKSYFTYKELWN